MKKILLYQIILFLIISCSQTIPEFDGEKAFQKIEEQCDIGFRYPGTEEIKILRKYIISEMEAVGAQIETQEYIVEIDNVEIDGQNITASFYPRKSRRILLGAHYDTRPWADKDADSLNHSKPVMGANDGGSGVAVLFEIGRILANNEPLQYGIDLVFFDLEDMGSYGNDDTWCVGSKYYAENFKGEKPEKAIVVDMIGDKDLAINMEFFSYKNSPALVNEVWDIAQDLGFTEFKSKIVTAIIDDHYSLIKEGFNAIDIIDFDYPVWHTINDTPEQCSSHSLYVVGQTLVTLIYSEK
ncbi:MAG: M28 family peptidase [Candidatus Cloacimonetes bacterium]|nr:M28 family peptidase [Candidatus Cloacimonadota bacterium]